MSRYLLSKFNQLLKLKFLHQKFREQSLLGYPMTIISRCNSRQAHPTDSEQLDCPVQSSILFKKHRVEILSVEVVVGRSPGEHPLPLMDIMSTVTLTTRILCRHISIMSRGHQHLSVPLRSLMKFLMIVMTLFKKKKRRRRTWCFIIEAIEM